MTSSALEAAGTSSPLRRAIRRPERPARQALSCQLCGAGLTDLHRHLLDDHSGELLCTCHPCTVLFDREAAGGEHYRLIPDRRVRLDAFAAQGLGIPVGLAFFVVQRNGAVVANYPSPLGATTYEVEPAQWRAVIDQCAAVGTVSPLVEAVLINTARGAREHWIVPLDDCYRLVAIIRQHWRGLSGGSTVWPAIEEFFTDLPKGNRHFGI